MNGWREVRLGVNGAQYAPHRVQPRGNNPMTEPWVSVEDVAKHLGLVKESVYRWIDTKRLPAQKLGKLWKLKLSEVDSSVRTGGAGATEHDKARAK